MLPTPRTSSIAPTDSSIGVPRRCARGNDPAEQNDGAPDGQDRQGVPDPPEHADQRCPANTAMARHDRRHRNHVVGVRRMPDAEHEA